MTTSAAPTTSTKEGHAHAEPADDGKTAGHAVARHGRSLESTGTRSRGERAEFPGTTRSPRGSAMELAREPGVGTKTQSGQTAGSGLRGGYRLSGGARLGEDGDASTGKRLRLGSQSREHLRDRTLWRGQKLPRIGAGAESMSRRVLGTLSPRRCPVSGTGSGPSRWQLAPLPGTSKSHRCPGHRCLRHGAP